MGVGYSRFGHAARHTRSSVSHVASGNRKQALEQVRMAETEMLVGWRAPRTRLSVAYLVCVLNFVMYASDPICFAVTECRILIVGNIINFVANPETYPEEEGPLALKALILLLWLPSGYFIGRHLVHHRLLRDRCRYRMFEENNGTIGVQAFTILVLGFIATRIWALLLARFWSKELSDKYTPNNHLPFSDAWFSFFAQTGCTAGDVLTIVMLWDTMLQDTTQYVSWHPRLRRAWRNPFLRLGCVWTVSISVFSAIMTLVTTMSREKVGAPIVEHWSQMERGFLAAFIFMLDVFVVCQDWEFPKFDNPLELKFFLWGSDRIGEVITGKWLNFGPMFVVMLIDMNNLSNQWRYGLIDAPGYYGQYLDNSGHIWTAANSTVASLMRAGALLNRTAFAVGRTRGPCQEAVPYEVGVALAEEPPCFPGDYRSGGQLRSLGLRPFGLSLVPLMIALGVFTCTSRELPKLQAEKERRKLQEKRREALLRLRRASRSRAVSIQLATVHLRRRSSAPTVSFAAPTSLARPSHRMQLSPAARVSKVALPCVPQSDFGPIERLVPQSLGGTGVFAGRSPFADSIRTESFADNEVPAMWPVLSTALTSTERPVSGSSDEDGASTSPSSKRLSSEPPPSWQLEALYPSSFAEVSSPWARLGPLGPPTGVEEDGLDNSRPGVGARQPSQPLRQAPQAQHPDAPTASFSSLIAASPKPLVLPNAHERSVAPKPRRISVVPPVSSG